MTSRTKTGKRPVSEPVSRIQPDIIQLMLEDRAEVCRTDAERVRYRLNQVITECLKDQRQAVRAVAYKALSDDDSLPLLAQLLAGSEIGSRFNALCLELYNELR